MSQVGRRYVGLPGLAGDRVRLLGPHDVGVGAGRRPPAPPEPGPVRARCRTCRSTSCSRATWCSSATRSTTWACTSAAANGARRQPPLGDHRVAHPRPRRRRPSGLIADAWRLAISCRSAARRGTWRCRSSWCGTSGWRCGESNPGPQQCDCCALPTELHPQRAPHASRAPRARSRRPCRTALVMSPRVRSIDGAQAVEGAAQTAGQRVGQVDGGERGRTRRPWPPAVPRPAPAPRPGAGRGRGGAARWPPRPRRSARPGPRRRARRRPGRSRPATRAAVARASTYSLAASCRKPAWATAG